MSTLLLLLALSMEVMWQHVAIGGVCHETVEGGRHSQVMTVVDRSSVEAVAPPPEYIVKEYTMPAPSACIIAALGGMSSSLV